MAQEIFVHENHGFVKILFGFGFAFALCMIFKNKIKDILNNSNDAQKFYIIMGVLVISFIFIGHYIGCGFISRSGRSNK